MNPWLTAHMPVDAWTQAGLIAAGLAVLIMLAASISRYNGKPASLAVAGLFFLALVVALCGWPYFAQLDHGFMVVVQAHRSSALDLLGVTLTQMGNFTCQLVVAVALCLILAFGRAWRPFGFALATTLGTALGNALIKSTFARVRPEVLLQPLGSYSMPSGHSSASFALCLTLGVLAGRGQAPARRLMWLALACLPALCVALSRVYLGAHWPTDVLAGALLAAMVCACSLTAVQWEAPLAPVAPATWRLIGAVLIALLAFFTIWDFSHEMLRYRH